MARARLLRLAAAALVTVGSAALSAALGFSEVRGRGPRAGFDGSSFVVEGLPPSWRMAVTAEDSLRVYSAGPGEAIEELPSLQGRARWSGLRLVFEPRYPPPPGAAFRLVVAPPRRSTAAVDLALELAASTPSPRARVVAIHPRAPVLPANQLKLYIEFSHPMHTWDPYEHIRLLDEATGEELANVFHEAAADLWSPDRKRFTLLFDPGRLKRGLRNHEIWGAPLTEGRAYRLEVSAGWRDGRGAPLVESFSRRFVAGPPDRESPAPDSWRISGPRPGGLERLAVAFPESLDHALLERALVVTDAELQPVQGRIELGRGDTSWSFVPRRRWARGSYRLLVDPLLEDLAGNNLDRLFDIDTTTSEVAPTGAPREIHFEVG